MKNKENEHLKLAQKYDYEISLLLNGMKTKEVLTLSKTMGNNLSIRTIQRLRNEYAK
jgi:hypothetical protein